MLTDVSADQRPDRRPSFGGRESVIHHVCEPARGHLDKTGRILQYALSRHDCEDEEKRLNVKRDGFIETGRAEAREEYLRELGEAYQRRGLAARVGFGSKPALLVIDVQRGFTDPRCSLGAEATEMVNVVRDLLVAARGANVPVVFTISVWSAVAETWARKLPGQRELTPGSEWVELDPRLGRRAEEMLIEKHFASAFFRTDVAEHLKALEVDTVIATGMTTSGCVRASVVDGCSHGFSVIVPSDAVNDRAESPHEMSLFDMDAKYGDVVTSDQVKKYFRKLAES